MGLDDLGEIFIIIAVFLLDVAAIPIDVKTGEPVVAKDIEAAATYIVAYIAAALTGTTPAAKPTTSVGFINILVIILFLSGTILILEYTDSDTDSDTDDTPDDIEVDKAINILEPIITGGIMGSLGSIIELYVGDDNPIGALIGVSSGIIGLILVPILEKKITPPTPTPTPTPTQ